LNETSNKPQKTICGKKVSLLLCILKVGKEYTEKQKIKCENVNYTEEAENREKWLGF
jgi:hypothetical protein